MFAAQAIDDVLTFLIRELRWALPVAPDVDADADDDAEADVGVEEIIARLFLIPTALWAEDPA